VFWISGRTTYDDDGGGGGDRQAKVHARSSVAPEPSAFEVELAVEKWERYKWPGVDQPAEQNRIVRHGKHERGTSVWNKKLMYEQWQESVSVHMYRKGNKAEGSNDRGISLLPTACEISCSIILSRLTLYVDEITGYCIKWLG
jgi:hypothetical protein